MVSPQLHYDQTCSSVTAILQHLTMPLSMISYSPPWVAPLILTLVQPARQERVLPSPLTSVLFFAMLNANL